MDCLFVRKRHMGKDGKHKAETYPKKRNRCKNSGDAKDPNIQSAANEDPNPHLPSSIHSLTPELLEQVFRNLDVQDKVTAARVCSLWHEVIDIPSVWKDAIVTVNLDKLTSKGLEKMQTRMIQRVRVTRCSKVKKLKKFLHAMLHLEFLDLPPLVFPLPQLAAAFPMKLHHLASLTISTPFLSSEVLESVSRGMTRLQCLTIESHTDSGILSAIRHLTSLQHFILAPVSGEIIEFAATPVENAEPMPSLRKLIIDDGIVGDIGLEFLSRVFPRLHTLRLTLSPDVTKDAMEKLGQLVELRDLDICTYDFKDDWMKCVKSGLPRLECLSVSACDRQTLHCLRMMSQMPELKLLRVQVRDQEVEGLVALSQGCPKLKILEVAHGDSTINFGLLYASRLPQLETLILSKCEVNDYFWQHNWKSFTKLRRLAFKSCPCLTDRCLQFLSHLPCLESLSFRNCEGIGDAGMTVLGKKGAFMSLISLELEKLSITDLGLLEVAGLPLQEMTVLFCDHVTEECLIAVVANLPRLQSLKSNVTSDTRRRLKKIRPC